MVDFWKRKKKEGFNFFFDMDKLEHMMDSMMQDMFSEEDMLSERRLRKPLVMGFSMKIGPDGRPVMEEFGNVRPSDGRMTVSDAREPLVDVHKTDKEVRITAELPGVEKKEINLKNEKDRIVLKVENPERQFYKEIELPAEVAPKTAKAKFNNGILEVVFQRANIERKEKGEIKVE